VFIVYPFEKVLQNEKKQFKDYEFIGISIEELKKLPFSIYKSYTDKLVIQQQVTIRNKKDYNAHRLLRAIDNNILLSKLQESEECKITDIMLPLDDIKIVYNNYPHIIANTENIINACSIDFSFGKDRISQNQKVYLESPEDDYKLLVKLCQENLNKRYSNPDEKVKARLETELATIKKMDFVSYFLINYDIISYSKRMGYIHVGR